MAATVAGNTGSTVVFDEPAVTQFQTSRNEVTIDRPAEEVWAILNDQSLEATRLWNPTVEGIDYISGERGQEGEVVVVGKDTGQTPFFMRTIRIVPNRQRVLRIDQVDGKMCGYVDHSLYEHDGRTTVVYNGYLETRLTAAEAQAVDLAAAQNGMMEYLQHGFGLLKEVLEAR
jgi:uncharacterized protein YndB with AHSA1/START domain